MIEAGQISPPHITSYPLTLPDLLDAVTRSKSRRGVGKIVLVSPSASVAPP
jgi:hypothetical protein